MATEVRMIASIKNVGKAAAWVEKALDSSLKCCYKELRIFPNIRHCNLIFWSFNL